MAKVIRLIELTLENYTSHRSLTVTYGDITRLSGPNGAGKSSIGGAPVWVLYGTDLWGKRWSPKPTTYEADVTRAALIIEVDGKQYKFERGLDGDAITYHLNDVPVKAKEYETAVAALFDKDEFMVSYYPAYFFGLHWTKQRELVLRNTTPPPKSEVFAEMSRTSQEQNVKDIPLNPAAAKLDELTKKHSLDQLTNIHSGKDGLKTKLEKKLIGDQREVKIRQEQLDKLPEPPSQFNPESAREESAALLQRIKEIEKAVESADENNRKINELKTRIQSLIEQREQMKEQYKQLKAEEVQENCRVCKQRLNEAAIEATKADKAKRIAKFEADYAALIERRKALEEELSKLEYIDVSEKIEEMRALEAKRDQLEDEIFAFNNRSSLQEQVEQARAVEAATLASLNESKFILDAIKAYRAKEAEIMAAKVQSLFTRLKIRLHEVQKNGEIKDAFMIQMDDKDYIQLSTGERMTCEQELLDVLVKKSDMVTPLFFDNFESYSGKLSAFGQIIIAEVDKNGDGLKVETEDME